MFQKNILSELIKISYEAGILIMDIYNHGFEVNHKNDNSPVTIADKKAEKFILEKLNKLFSCLLYTSPSPRDKRQSRMPSSA